MPNVLIKILIIFFAFAITILPGYLVRHLLLLEKSKFNKKRLGIWLTIEVLSGVAIILLATIFFGTEKFIEWLLPTSYQDFRDIIIFALVITILPISLISYLLFLENPKIDKKKLFKRAIIGVALAILCIVWVDVIVGFTTLIKWLLPTTFKDFIQLIQSFAALIVIIGGLRWFFKRGKHLPRANVSQKLDYYLEDDNKIFIMIDITISNPGDVILEIKSGFVSIHQLKPFTAEIKNAITNVIETPTPIKELYKYNIELDDAPITIEQNITHTHHIQFFMNSKVKDAGGNDVLLEVFEAYTVIYNPYNSDNNWLTTTIQKIEAPVISSQISVPKGFISRLLSRFMGV